ncbi:MAG: hypothetical protein KJP23_16335 [Deltaproteobacteria bacterium]|nr:hypothetical protein [Deltaproteobacteria bacterium]
MKEGSYHAIIRHPYQSQNYRQGYDAGTKEGRHLPEFGDTEGETEQKEGNGKVKARLAIKNSFWELTTLIQQD